MTDTIADITKTLNTSSFIMNRKLNHTYTIWCHNQNAATNTPHTITDANGHETPITTNRRINTDPWYNVTSFSTVNQFWASVKAFLDRPRMISNGMLFIMRDGISPDWSNDVNINGGRISWKLDKPEAAACWENICCLLISGEFDKMFGEYSIHGISISPKKASNIIKLWLGKTVSDSVMSSIELPEKCIFKDKLMIFRANADSSTFVSCASVQSNGSTNDTLSSSNNEVDSDAGNIAIGSTSRHRLVRGGGKKLISRSSKASSRSESPISTASIEQ